MRILKKVQEIEQLEKLETEVETRELARRDALIARITKSRENNLKVFRLNPKGD